MEVVIRLRRACATVGAKKVGLQLDRMLSQSDPAKASGKVWVFGKPGNCAVGFIWMHHLSASPEERTRRMK